MAQRLAKEVGRRKGFKAECLHLDIDKGDRADTKEMSKDESAHHGRGTRCGNDQRYERAKQVGEDRRR